MISNTPSYLIGIFCSSSDAVPKTYLQLAEDFAKVMLEKNWGLVYGGGDVGLMGSVARFLSENNGYVLGVITKRILKFGVQSKEFNDMIVTDTMRERKAIMEERADAYVILPGGFGTLEELSEVITLKELGEHNKPIVILNYEGFYDPLLQFYEKMYEQKFAKQEFRKLYHVAPTINDAVDYIVNYKEETLPIKWYEDYKRKE